MTTFCRSSGTSALMSITVSGQHLGQFFFGTRRPLLRRSCSHRRSSASRAFSSASRFASSASLPLPPACDHGDRH